MCGPYCEVGCSPYNFAWQVYRRYRGLPAAQGLSHKFSLSRALAQPNIQGNHLHQISGSELVIDYFLFDLDGTVTTEELLPRIARYIGVEDEIRELTQRTIAGDIPFEHSLRHRVEILNVASIPEVRGVVAGVGLDPHIISFIQSHADRCRIITGNIDAWLEDLIPQLGAPVLSSSVRVVHDKIFDFIQIMDKGEAIKQFSGKICAIGEGHNDCGMLAAADLGIAYGGVHGPARTLLEVATHAIYDGETLCRFLSQL
jgi:phosphoserine phosphatase